jgi:deoxyadenosine/deoxycytidine kinase
VQSRRIEIAGAIASGKTTLATILGQAGIAPILEDFDANPFWRAFNLDRQAHAFETETTFLLQHYHDIKLASGTGLPIVCDFSPLLDLAYANVTLTNVERGLFFPLVQHVQKVIGPPALVIQVQCRPAAAIERIRLRGRAAEMTITPKYLESVSGQLAEILAKTQPGQAFMVIDTERENIVGDGEVRRKIIERIRGHL